MLNCFQLQLNDFLESHNCNQSELVTKLKKYDPKLFSGLDINTLNRWVNGKSQPSLKKKLCALAALRCDLKTFILTHSQPITTREEKIFQEYLYKVDSSISPGYVKITKPVITFELMKKDLIRHNFESYYSNISAYIRIRNLMDPYNEDYTFKVYSAFMGSTRVGHLAFTDPVGQSFIKAVNLNEKYNDYICIIPAYYINSETMLSLFLNFLKDFLLDTESCKNRNILILFSSPHSAKLFELHFNATLVQFFAKSKGSLATDRGLYLFELNIFDVLSSSVIFNHMKSMF